MKLLNRLRLLTAALAATAATAAVGTLLLGDFRSGKTIPATKDPSRPDGNRVTEELAQNRFSQLPTVTYRLHNGETLFAWQVRAELAAGPARPRDVLVMVDTSASQAGLPLRQARQIVQGLADACGPDDRLALWAANTPKTTHALTKDFLEPASDALRKPPTAAITEVEYGSGAVDLKGALEKALARRPAQPRPAPGHPVPRRRRERVRPRLRGRPRRAGRPDGTGRRLLLRRPARAQGGPGQPARLRLADRRDGRPGPGGSQRPGQAGRIRRPVEGRARRAGLEAGSGRLRAGGGGVLPHKDAAAARRQADPRHRQAGRPGRQGDGPGRGHRRQPQGRARARREPVRRPRGQLLPQPHGRPVARGPAQGRPGYASGGPRPRPCLYAGAAVPRRVPDPGRLGHQREQARRGRQDVRGGREDRPHQPRGRDRAQADGVDEGREADEGRPRQAHQRQGPVAQDRPGPGDEDRAAGAGRPRSRGRPRTGRGRAAPGGPAPRGAVASGDRGAALPRPRRIDHPPGPPAPADQPGRRLPGPQAAARRRPHLRRPRRRRPAAARGRPRIAACGTSAPRGPRSSGRRRPSASRSPAPASGSTSSTASRGSRTRPRPASTPSASSCSRPGTSWPTRRPRS